MSSESSQSLARPSSSIRGTNVPTRAESCKFGTVVRALWPVKPALNLAQRVGCTERAANFYIKGERDPSHDALMAVLDEMRPRRRV